MANARQKAIKESKSLGQALKIAASNDANIGTKEFKNIQKTFGSRADQVVSRLDKINEKFGAERGNIGIKGNTANRYASGGFGPTTGIGFGNTGGSLASALAGMNDTYTPMRQGQGGYKTEGFGKAPKGSSIWGYANNAPLYREATKGATGSTSNGWAQFAPSLIPQTTEPAAATASTGAADSTNPISTDSTAGQINSDINANTMGDPYSIMGASTWKTAKKGKSKGIKSTSAASRGQRTAPSWQTLGV